SLVRPASGRLGYMTSGAAAAPSAADPTAAETSRLFELTVLTAVPTVMIDQRSLTLGAWYARTRRQIQAPTSRQTGRSGNASRLLEPPTTLRIRSVLAPI